MRIMILTLTGILAACASHAPQYYSLQAPAVGSAQPKKEVSRDFVISVQPVLIPEQLSRPQILVASPDSAEVVPLNVALWAGPLEAQIRDALADSLSKRLNVLDLGPAKADGTPVWRVYVDVQRFDSLYGKEVRQDIVWRLEPQGMPRGVKKRVCSAQARIPVDEGMASLVAGHRQALDSLADVIAQTIPTRDKNASASAEFAREGLNFRGCVG